MDKYKQTSLNNKVSNNLDFNERLMNVKKGLMELFLTIFEFQTIYYAAIFFAIVMVTYSLTMANVYYHFGEMLSSQYYTLLTVVSVCPIFILNLVQLGNYLNKFEHKKSLKIFNISIYSFFGGAIFVLISIINKSQSVSFMELEALMLLFFVIGYCYFITKDINLSFYKREFIVSKKIS